jgi:hypothetical protein
MCQGTFLVDLAGTVVEINRKNLRVNELPV